MSDDKLELVTDFKQLGPGMLVVSKCAWADCRQSEHRGMLGNCHNGLVCTPDGGVSSMRYYLFVEEIWHRHGTQQFVVGEHAVQRRSVYRVVDQQWEREKERSKRVMTFLLGGVR